MLRQDKEQVVAELVERLRSTQTLIVADYRGLTMTEIDGLRGELLNHGARFSVVKNTLTRIAAETAGVQPLLDLISGPTAIAFIDADGDPAAVAKVLNDTARTTDVLVLRGGLLDGEAVDEGQIKNLATLPPADVLRGQLVGAVVGPLTMVVALFTAPLRDLVNVIDARIEQLKEQGEEVPVEEPAGEVAGAPEPEAETPAEAEPMAEAEPTAEAEAPAEEPAAEEPAAEAEPPAEEPEAEAEPEPAVEEQARGESTEEEQPPEADEAAEETEE
jgi:large subunit ribosomal protein L10